MGWYQWQLFVVIGFGWASDNLWPIVTSLIFTPITNEFNPSRPPLLTLAQNIGLLGGAMFWGFGCDVFGRKWAFNLTLGVTAVFGMIAASSPNFAAIGCFAAFWSFGVGGNLYVTLSPHFLSCVLQCTKTDCISGLLTARSSSNSFQARISIF